MSVIGANQVGHILIGATYHGNSDISDFITNAGNKALQVVSKDSASLQAGPFQILQKASDMAAGFKYSEVINPSKIGKITVKAFTAASSRQVKVSGFSGTVRGNVTYQVFIRLYNDGGSLSPENFRFINGFYVTPQDASALTFADVLAGLKASLDGALSREYNSSFVITTNASELIVEAGNTEFVLGVKDGRPVEFDLQAAVRDNGGDNTVSDARYDDLAVELVQAGSAGSGTGNAVANLEWARVGQEGNKYRLVGYPANFREIYHADPTLTYHVVNISYYEDRTSTIVERQYRVIQIAVENVDQDGGGAGTVFTAINALITDLNTATGLSLAALV
tara:strand:- start:1198 stop:2205 length:1008 start_codon:yes stop_codon:yes gene_type:complete